MCIRDRLITLRTPLSRRVLGAHVSYMPGERWIRALPGWECVWTRKKLDQTLSVYVGDFKLAGPAANPKAGWGLIRWGGIELDPPTPCSQYLG
eukprot:5157364-Pyramimonas_sp.AAC.1